MLTDILYQSYVWFIAGAGVLPTLLLILLLQLQLQVLRGGDLLLLVTGARGLGVHKPGLLT